VGYEITKIEEKLKNYFKIEEDDLDKLRKMRKKEDINMCVYTVIIPNITLASMELLFAAFLLKSYLDTRNRRTKVLLYLADVVEMLRTELHKYGYDPDIYDRKANLYLFTMFAFSIARNVSMRVPGFTKDIFFEFLSDRINNIMYTSEFMTLTEMTTKNLLKNGYHIEQERSGTITWPPNALIGVLASLTDLFLKTKDIDFLRRIFKCENIDLQKGEKDKRDNYVFVCFIRGIYENFFKGVLEILGKIYKGRGDSRLIQLIKFKELGADPWALKKISIHYPIKYTKGWKGSSYEKIRNVIKEMEDYIGELIKDDPIGFFGERVTEMDLLNKMFEDVEPVRRYINYFKGRKDGA